MQKHSKSYYMISHAEKGLSLHSVPFFLALKFFSGR